jgi:hypothetical protein
MSKIVVIGSQEFELPEQGSNPDYGSELTDFFVAVADALESVQGQDDILLTTATISNNVSVFTSIPSFSFSTASVQAIECSYIVERTTTSPAQKFVESGTIVGNYDGANWLMSSNFVGDAGVTFSISAAGQMQYKSTLVSGSGYVGTIKFRAKTISE